MISSRDERGAVLISTFIVMVTLTAIVAGFLYMNSVQTVGIGTGIPDSKAVWVAEAGLQKAVYYLKTSGLSGSCFSGLNPSGENWTTAGCTENLGDGSYTMAVAKYDFASAANGSSASATSSATNQGSANAIDDNDSTYWESADKPKKDPPQEIIVTFPYPLTINKVEFVVPAGSDQEAPKDYDWLVSTDSACSNYISVLPAAQAQNQSNSCLDRIDTFQAVSNVNCLKLSVTKHNGGGNGVRIATLKAIGAKVTSTGTVALLNRNVQQTVTVIDGVTVPTCSTVTTPAKAANEIDWTEI